MAREARELVKALNVELRSGAGADADTERIMAAVAHTTRTGPPLIGGAVSAADAHLVRMYSTGSLR